jgi:hypothetical protein
MAYVSPCSSPGPTLACSGPDSPRLCPRHRPFNPHCAPHSTASNRKSKPAANGRGLLRQRRMKIPQIAGRKLPSSR